MRWENLYLAGSAANLPRRVRVTEAVQRGWYDEISHQRTRYESVCVADEPGVDLAAGAGRTALERSGYQPDDVSLLLYATANYQGLGGWNAASYVQARCVGDRALAVEICQLSNGAMASLELAAGFLHADGSRTAALLATGDRFALPGFDRWRADANVIWGDAGTAIVVSKERGFARIQSLVSVSDSSLEGLFRGDEALLPAPDATQLPLDLERRQRQFLARSDAREVKRRLTAGLARSVEGALADAGTSLDQICHAVVPTLGGQLLERFYLPPLKLDLSRTTWDWARTVGHLGAGDQFAGLNHLVTSAALRPGDRVLLVGLGAGYAWTSAVVEMVELPHWPTADVPDRRTDQ